MDRDQLTAYLKSSKRSISAINRTLWALDVFETWLKDVCGLSIDTNISPEDLEAFIQSAEEKQKNLLLGLANVFEFQGKDTLKTTVLQMRRSMLNKENKPIRLRDFLGMDPRLIAALEARDVRDAWQLLHICPTPEDRQ